MMASSAHHMDIVVSETTDPLDPLRYESACSCGWQAAKRRRHWGRAIDDYSEQHWRVVSPAARPQATKEGGV